MRIAVILGVILVLIAAAAGIWYFMQPSAVQVAQKATPTDIGAACSDESAQTVQLIEAVKSGKTSDCPVYPVFKSYCLAVLGKDTCSKLEREDEKTACAAIIAKNPAGCNNDAYCIALAGGAMACSGLTGDDQNTCLAIAGSDTSVFTDPSFCSAEQEKAQAIQSCSNSAASPESLDACLNA